MILRKRLGLAFREGGRLERVSSGGGSDERDQGWARRASRFILVE